MYEPEHLKRGFVKLEGDPTRQKPAAPSDWLDNPHRDEAAAAMLAKWPAEPENETPAEELPAPDSDVFEKKIAEGLSSPDAYTAALDEIAARQALQELNRRELEAEIDAAYGAPLRREGETLESYVMRAKEQASPMRGTCQVMKAPAWPHPRTLSIYSDDELLAELRRRGLNREVGAEERFTFRQLEVAHPALVPLAESAVARAIGMRLLADGELEFTTLRDERQDRVTVRASFRYVRMTKRPPRGQGER